MALLFMDSFDHYATTDILRKYYGGTGIGTTTVIAATEGRRGSGALKSTQMAANSENPMVTQVLAPADATCIVGAACKPTLVTPDFPLFTVGDNSSWHIGLYGTTGGLLNVRRGATYGGTVLGATSAPLPTGAFTYVEIKVTIHDSAGVFVVRFNGTEVLSLTGVDTQHLALAGWTRVAFHTLDFSSQPLWLDDLYVLDGSGAAPWNAFLGDVRVDARLPTGAGAVTQWTPSAGANWQTVDDATPDDDATYNAAASAPLTDTLVVQDAPVAGATLHGVQVNLLARKTDAGTCALASVVRQGTTNLAATAQNPSTAYAYLRTVYQTNPHTSAAWTEADFNADEFGYSRTA